MQRTYDAARRVVKGAALFLGLGVAAPAAGQGLPVYSPVNPVAASRSGIYFQPFRERAPGRWMVTLGMDYASIIEYNLLTAASYVLDSEILQLTLGLSRDLGARSFLLLSATATGAYHGFLDGFLDWYHAALGIRISEREQRPRDRFLYSVSLADGRTVARPSSDLFLGDIRAGLGLRLNPGLQTVLSLTLPTSTGPEGYGRGAPSLAALTTVRSPADGAVVYEGSVGVGLTPRFGPLAELQRTAFLAVSSGLRYRFSRSQSLYGNLFYHSPYYRDTNLPALDRRELSLDVGWILETRRGGEWRLGLIEDLEPGGPGVDLVLRLGRTF